MQGRYSPAAPTSFGRKFRRLALRVFLYGTAVCAAFGGVLGFLYFREINQDLPSVD